MSEKNFKFLHSMYFTIIYTSLHFQKCSKYCSTKFNMIFFANINYMYYVYYTPTHRSESFYRAVSYPTNEVFTK